ncbi:hypothetical protein ACWERY_15955 [Streptomyces sp. NPDC004082]
MHTHTPAEWASVLSLGLVPVGLIGIAVAFAPADREYFDPRPAVRRAVAVVHQLLVHAGHDLNRLIATVQQHLKPSREALRDAAALLILLTTRPNGATQ